MKWKINGLPASGVPGARDNVQIDRGTVEIGSTADANKLTVAQNAKLKVRSDLSLGGASSISGLELHAKLANASTLTLVGESEWLNGQLIGPGLVINRSTLDVHRGIRRTIKSKTFRNFGTIYSNIEIRLEDFATLDNASSVVLNNASISETVAGSTLLINSGTIAANTRPSDIHVLLQNDGGTLRAADGGTLRVHQGVTLSGGTIDSGEDSLVVFQGPQQTFTGNVSTRGQGRVLMRKATTINGQMTNTLRGGGEVFYVDSEGLDIKADLTGSGSLINNGRMSWDFGRIALGGGVENFGKIFLRGAQSKLASKLRNKRATGESFVEREIRHEAGNLLLEAGAELVNERSARYEFRKRGAVGPSISGPGTFVNRGELSVAGTATDTVTIGSAYRLEDGSEVGVYFGKLQFTGSGTATGTSTFEVAPYRTLEFDSGTHAFKSGTHTVSGKGMLANKRTAHIVVEGNAELVVKLSSPGSWNIASPTSAIDNGRVVNQGNAAWTGDNIGSAGNGSFVNEGTLRIDGGSQKSLKGRLINEGTVQQMRAFKITSTAGQAQLINRGSWQQGSNIDVTQNVSDTPIRNKGAWRFTGDATITGRSLQPFNNEGTIRVAPGKEVRFSIPFGSEFDALENWLDVDLEDASDGARTTLRFEGSVSADGGRAYIGSHGTIQLSHSFFANGDIAFWGHRDGTSLLEINGDILGEQLPSSVPTSHIPSYLEFDVPGSVGTGSSGTVLNASPPYSGLHGSGTHMANLAAFTWVSGAIGSTFRNEGQLQIEGSSRHSLEGSLRNASGAWVFHEGELSLHGPHAAVENRGTWTLQNGAKLRARTVGEGVFTNTSGRLVLEPELFSSEEHNAIVAVPFDNSNGLVRVRATSDQPLTSLSFEASSNVVRDGELDRGEWQALGINARLRFSEAITSLSDNTVVVGTTRQIPELQLRENQGRFLTPEAAFPERFVNRGTCTLTDTQGASAKKIATGDDFINAIGDNERAVVECVINDSHGVLALASAALGSGSGLPLPDVGFDVGDNRFINQGIVRPGGQHDAGAFPLIGNFVQESTGILEVELGGVVPIVDHDYSVIYGDASLDGTVAVSLLEADGVEFQPQAGDVFEFLATTGAITGQFSNYQLPEIHPSLAWRTIADSQSVSLAVSQAADFNNDGFVDGADFATWQLNVGIDSGATIAEGDVDGDGDVGGADFLGWQRQFGARPGELQLAQITALPEPSCVALLLAFSLIGILRRRASFFEQGHRP